MNTRFFLKILFAAVTMTGAAAANFTTSVTQGVGQNWNAAIWVPEGGGTAVAPRAGNTYEVVANATTIANLSANARVRNPTAAGMHTFPGDSLTIRTNAEFRFKTGSGLGPINFPGVDGNPGFIMDGGVWNIADAFVPTVTGRVHIASTLLYNAVNDHGGNLDAARGINLNAILSGPGTFVAFNAHTNTPISIGSDSNTFTGKWLITGGRLLGRGKNSLGTNDITIDPLADLALPDLEAFLKRGPAVLELNYDINSAGTLTLANGGMMILHQNCTFAAVNIEGTALARRTHSYAELAANFPSTFLPGGSGSITVQPFGAPPVLAPQITTQPLGQSRYAGGTIKLSALASGAQPLAYQWQVNTGAGFANVAEGNGISGSTSATLTIADFQSAKAGDYHLVISNSAGILTSAVARVSIATPVGGAYETALLAARPHAYYQLNETGDPATNAPAFDFVGGYNGTYGSTMQNGHTAYNIRGPLPSEGFPGFVADNRAARGTSLDAGGDGENSRIDLPPWNLNTNAVTMTAWIFPVGPPAARAGVVFSRAADTIAGIYFSGTANANGNFTLGYNWNDEGPTFNWNSGLEVPPDQWSLVSLVVTPTNATIYVIGKDRFRSAVNTYAHVIEPFNGAGIIGNDTFNLPLRAFNGRIDDVAVFNRSLPQSEILAFYGAASGVTSFAPTISTQPAAQTIFAGQSAELSVVAGGNPTPSFQWQVRQGAGAFVNIVDGGTISGSTTARLTFENVALSSGGEYRVVVSNAVGSVTSEVAALTVQPTGPAERITTEAFLPIGQDWNSPDVWSDGNPASVSAVAKPGSTYEVLPGARLRSPDGALDSTFPGDELIISGDGIFANNPPAGSTIGELRFKQGGPVGTVRFKKLTMNGGQLDATNPNILILAGHVDIKTNTPIYNDTTADRGCQIDAWLTGTGTIEYHAYNLAELQSGFVYNLNITGRSNTFSGKWNVALGVLLGSAPGSLGTNDITVGAEGALETLYDINSPKGTLVLDGAIYLHQNHTFKSVVLNGVSLAPGTYSFAQLRAAHPEHFPSSWTMQSGSTINTGSGSITVLGDTAAEVRLSLEVLAGGTLRLTWPTGRLQETLTLPGGWSTLNATSPHTITPSGPSKFYRVIIP